MFTVSSDHKCEITRLHYIFQRLGIEAELVVSDVENHFLRLSGRKSYLAEAFKLLQRTLYGRLDIGDVHLCRLLGLNAAGVLHAESHGPRRRHPEGLPEHCS